MKITALALVACGCLASAAGPTHAQGTDLRIIAPSAPGTGWDQIAQTLRAALAEKSGLAATVTNIPGGTGMVGLSQFLADRTETDLLVTGLAMLEATLLSRNGPDLDKLTPIARLSSDHFAIAVAADSPLRSIGDLASTFVADPGKLTWAGGPPGSVEHVATILLAGAVGVAPSQLNYVPFLTGAEGRGAAVEGKVGAVMLALSELETEVAAGKLRLLAVSAPERLGGLDVATLAESGVPLVFANWRGVAAKPGLPREQQFRLAELVYAATLSNAWQQTIASRKWRNDYLPPDSFRAFIQQEQQRLRAALKAAGLLKRNGE